MIKKSCFSFSAAVISFFGIMSNTNAEQVIFKLNAPEAKQVFLAGEMTDWDTNKKEMHRGEDGIWRVSMDLNVGEWVYKYIVDGKWIADPGTDQHASDSQGGQHSFLFVGDGAWKQDNTIAHGTVETTMVPSKEWGKPMLVHTYLPPNFQHGQQLPVLLLLHGSGTDADQWFKTGNIHRYMDNLIATKAIQPFVIVMPSSERVFYINQSERFITKELPQWLEKTYGLHPGPKAFAVAGMSMGGFGAFHLPQAHPDQFGFGFALSGYFLKDFVDQIPKNKPLPFKFMMLTGSEDMVTGDDGMTVIDTNRHLVNVLKSNGSHFYYRENNGAHTFQYWSNRAVEMLTSVNAFMSGGDVIHNENNLVLANSGSVKK